MHKLVGVFLLLTVGSAHAIPRAWILEDVVFDDGTTATGSFVYDADTDTLSDISIVTQNGLANDGSPLTAQTYTQLYSGTPVSDPVILNQAGNTGTDDTYLVLSFAAPLTNNGGAWWSSRRAS
ncbi:MAG: hypothetical protein QF803_01515 [Gammaproteobacteria bacterium]|jgi:hypothetical protein|nr:hypothetical protein [Gammaproteobacteria bacterium]MDP6694274.1 hypothetical protein [Gammaproteobacteria bacterium]